MIMETILCFVAYILGYIIGFGIIYFGMTWQSKKEEKEYQEALADYLEEMPGKQYKVLKKLCKKQRRTKK